MEAVPTSPTVKSGSNVLWDAWFDSGMVQLQTADRLRFARPDFAQDADYRKKIRRVCGDAADWFRQAIQQANGFTNKEHRLCISKAGLAWDRYWQGDIEGARTCASEALACLQVNLQKQPTLPTTDDAHRTLASARCNLILGVLSYEEMQFLPAIQYLDTSVTAFARLNTSNPDVSTADRCAAEALWETDRFQEAILRIQRADRGLPTTEIWNPFRAAILSQTADWLMLDGQYRQASLRYARWLRFVPTLQPEQCGEKQMWLEEFAGQAVVFARAFIMLGELAMADDCLNKAEAAIEYIADPAPNVVVALATQRAAYLRCLGLIVDARNRIACVDELHANDPLVLLRAALVRAEIEYDAGQFTEAGRLFTQADQHLKDTKGTRYTERIQIWLGMSRIDTVRSLLLGAAEKAGNAFRELEMSGRVAQPESAFALHDLAMSLLRDNKSDESWPLTERAVEMLKAALGPQHPSIVSMLNTKAEVAWVIGGLSDPDSIGSTGFRICEEVQKLIEAKYPSRWFDLARSHSIQARLLHFKRCLRQAEAEFRCSLAQWECAERMLGAEHPEKSWTILALAALYAGTDREAEAESLYEAVACLMLEMKLTKDAMGYEFNRLGNLYFETRLFREAQWLYSHSVALYQSHFGANHAHTKQAQANLSKATDAINQQ